MQKGNGPNLNLRRLPPVVRLEAPVSPVSLRNGPGRMGRRPLVFESVVSLTRPIYSGKSKLQPQFVVVERPTALEKRGAVPGARSSDDYWAALPEARLRVSSF